MRSPAAPTAHAEVFALLDGEDHEARPGSRLYTGWSHTHRCTDPATLEATWAAVRADLRAGLHAVLLADYEWGARLVDAGLGHARLAPQAPAPALQLLMFRQLQRLDAAALEAWLAARDEGAPAGVMHLRESVDDAAFDAAIAAIHAAIADGETYQVNYSYRLDGQAYGTPLALYRRLRARQPVPFGALIALPHEAGSSPEPAAQRWLLSRSPELFLSQQGGRIRARPMKGTARRLADEQADRAQAAALGADPKNRAENLMIVDLMRNDLGRIAQVGTVKVPALFAVEPYATVWQMTSTVEARLRPEVDMPALLRAAFPCGSITGAPKLHTMDLIARLESTPRGLYCGAIGWVDAPADPAQAIEDLSLSVAIRTATLGPEEGGHRALRLGIGAGIVRDSVAADERAECRLKARFLTGIDPGFELFETMRAEPGHGVGLMRDHLDRLARSAAALGFSVDRDQAEALLHRAERDLHVVERWRLGLAHDGQLTLKRAPLAPLPAAADGVLGAPVRLIVAPQRLPAQAPLAAFKTSWRAHYDAGIAAAEAVGAFDSLFLGADGRVVEGGRSNVFARLDGRWWTPPVADGALPGVMRAQLMADPLIDARERRLSLAELHRAEAIWVSNALRGVLRAELVEAVAGATPRPPAAAARGAG